MTSLGAGGSLIAAALCAAAFVGGLLAFRGAVDGPAEARSGDVTLPGATAPAPAPASGPAAPPASAEAGDAVSAPPAVERRATPRRTGSRRVRRPQPPAPAPEAPATGGGGTTQTSGEGAGGGTEPAASAPPSATGEQAGTARRTVQQTREAVAPVVDAAPEPVQPTVNQVADAVEDVAGAVDETLAPVTGLLP
jgi:hypothetical protein